MSLRISRIALNRIGSQIRQQSTLALEAEEELKPLSEIPGPRGLPIVGSALDFLVPHRHEVLQRNRNKYGPIFKESLGPRTSVNLCNPDDVEHMYRTEGNFPHRLQVPPWKLYREVKGLPMSIVLSNGAEWKQARSAVNKPMLRMKSIMDHFTELNEVADDMIHRLTARRQHDHMMHDIDQELFRWSLESVGTVMFEQRLGCLEETPQKDIADFINSVKTILNPTKLLFAKPEWARNLGLPSWSEHEKAWDMIYEVGQRMIERRSTTINSQEPEVATPEADEPPRGVLSSLLNMAPFSDDPVLLNTLVTDLFLGAVDTTPNSMQFVLLLLAKNPEKQDILRFELDKVLTNGKITSPALLQEVPYLKAVLKESLRLYPTVPVYGKITQEDMVIRGYKIPAKSMLNVVCCAMGRDPELFHDPDAFKPERWFDKEKEQIHPYASIPFGHGRRSCVGRRVAELQMHLLLTKLVSNFEIQSADNEPIKAKVKLLMSPKTSPKIRLLDRR